MRNYLLLIVFLFSLTSNYANSTIYTSREYNCHSTATHSLCTLSQKEKIQAELINGVWLHQLIEGNAHLGLKEIYEFGELGQLKCTTVFGNGHAETSNHLWRIEEVEDRAFLVIFDSELREEIYYGITQSCKGVSLTDLSSQETTFLSFHREIEHAELESTRLRIAGQWHVNGNPFEPKVDTALDNPFLNYDFDLNGKFVRIMGDDHQKVEEQGFWEVSNDGQFLLMKFSKTGAAEDVYTTQYIRLNRVGLDRLELGHSLTTVGAYADVFCSGQKNIKLQKALSSF